jgi:hypothetical protein
VIRVLAWCDRNAGIIIAVLCAMLALAILTGCGDARSPQQSGDDLPPGVVATLGSLGATLTWAGGICAAAGIALRIVALFYPPLAGLGVLFGFLGIAGLSVTATGAAFQWLASYPWIMGLAVAASIGAVGWWYWPRIRRVLDRRLDGKA